MRQKTFFKKTKKLSNIIVEYKNVPNLTEILQIKMSSTIFNYLFYGKWNTIVTATIVYGRYFTT